MKFSGCFFLSCCPKSCKKGAASQGKGIQELNVSTAQAGTLISMTGHYHTAPEEEEQSESDKNPLLTIQIHDDETGLKSSQEHGQGQQDKWSGISISTG